MGIIDQLFGGFYDCSSQFAMNAQQMMNTSSASCMQSSFPRYVDWVSNSDTVMQGIEPEPRCEYCRGLFAKDATKCQNCGAPR